jgi:hypothetical protein
MELNTITLGDFVKLADVIWLKAKKSVPEYAKNSGLFKVMPIPAGTGNSREFSEIDLEEYATIKGQSSQADRAKVQQGYTKTMYSYRIAKDIGISYEMRTQNKAVEVVNRLTNLGKLAPRRFDLDLSNRIGFATATSYTSKEGKTIDTSVGDGYQLAYSAHELKGSSTTFRNRLANNPKLSPGSLTAIEELRVEQTYNQFGEKMTINDDILWTTDNPEDVKMAQYILRSTSSMDYNNSGVVNPDQGKYRHVVLPRVAMTAAGAPDSDKKHYWGTASSEHSTAYVGIWEEAHLKKPATLNAGEEFSTDDWNFGVRMGYGICIPSASWFRFSSGDATA